MGLLDDLKQQANSLREKQQISQADISQNVLIAHAKLKDALHYWIEMFNSLNVIKPVIPRSYYLEGRSSMFDNLLQSDYNVNGRRLTLDHKDYIEAIVLRFRCVPATEQKLTIEKDTNALVERMREHLWSNNLKFDVKEVRNDRGHVVRGIFTVACEVPVLVTVSADFENAQIKITTKNLEKFGEYSSIYDFDEFGSEVLEELGKVILGKPNEFRFMGKRQAAMRTTLIRSSRVEPDARAASHAAQSAKDRAGDPTKTLLGNIKSILKR
jgi:hypothetical protein